MSVYPQAMGKSVLYKAGAEICKACTNLSTAKYQYSFPRAPRFGEKFKTDEEKQKEKEEEKERRKEDAEKEKNGKYVKHDFYYLPSTLDKRFTRFGYGNKSDFTAGKKNDNEKSNQNDEAEDAIMKKIKANEKLTFKESKLYYHSLLGSNFPSKFTSNEGYHFCKFDSRKKKKDETPGPGAYIMPSEFGIYQKEDEDRYKYEKKELDDPKPWRHGMKKIKPKEEEEDYGGEDAGGNEDEQNQDNENNDQGKQEENQEEKQEEKQEEENENKDEKEEDKESECIMLRDMLMYKEEEKNANENANETPNEKPNENANENANENPNENA